MIMSYVAGLPNFVSNHNEVVVVSLCYYREMVNPGSIVLTLLYFSVTKAIIVGHNTLKVNFQLDWSWAPPNTFSLMFLKSVFQPLIFAFACWIAVVSFNVCCKICFGSYCVVCCIVGCQLQLTIKSSCIVCLLQASTRWANCDATCSCGWSCLWPFLCECLDVVEHCLLCDAGLVLEGEN